MNVLKNDLSFLLLTSTSVAQQYNSIFLNLFFIIDLLVLPVGYEVVNINGIPRYEMVRQENGNVECQQFDNDTLCKMFGSFSI